MIGVSKSCWTLATSMISGVCVLGLRGGDECRHGVGDHGLHQRMLVLLINVVEAIGEPAATGRAPRACLAAWVFVSPAGASIDPPGLLRHGVARACRWRPRVGAVVITLATRRH